jgi:peroxiredoxin
MSADGRVPQTNWRVKESLPYPLLSDKSKAALRSLGFVAGGKILRGHIIVGKRGVVQQHAAGIKPLDSVERALAFCVEKGKEGDAEEGAGETG